MKGQQVTRPDVKRSQSKKQSKSSVVAANSVASPGLSRSLGGMISETVSCDDCGRVISNDVCALQCDRCVGKETWTCIDCLNMTNETYMQLMREAEKPKSKVRWFCDSCDKMVMSPGNGQQEKLDAAIKLMEQMLERTQIIEQRLQGIEQRNADKADVSVVNQLELRVEKLELEINLRLSVVPDKTVSADHGIEENLNELKEREKRKNNLIVFNIPECNSTDCNERKQYDASEVGCILNLELGLHTSVDNPVRLGPKSDNSKWPRPLKVTVEDESVKWNVLKMAKNLANSGKETYRTVFFKKDMTPLERKLDAELRQDLQSKRKLAEEQGLKENWIIRRGKVIKLLT